MQSLGKQWFYSGALQSAQRRHPRPETICRFLGSCCSFSLDVRRLAKSSVVSGLEEIETDVSMEQSAEATVDAAEHILVHAVMKYSSRTSIRKLKLGMHADDSFHLKQVRKKAKLQPQLKGYCP